MMLFHVIVAIHASLGDTDYIYRRCLTHCVHKVSNCSDQSNIQLKRHWLALSTSTGDVLHHLLSFLVPTWNCEELCSYNCMRNITMDRKSKGLSVFKYYGHWSFYRYFNLEEPASVLFSIMNGFSYILVLVRKPKLNYSYYMEPWVVNIYPLVSINAWIFSAIYHAKKTAMATLLDYIAALLLLSYSLWIVLRRIWGSQARAHHVSMVCIFYTSLVLYRINEMIHGRVSYDDHMKLCISISILHVILWLSLSFHQLWVLRRNNIKDGKSGIFYKINEKGVNSNGNEVSADNNVKYSNMVSDKQATKPKSCIYVNHSLNIRNTNRWVLCIFCQVWFILASLLELFDFPPILFELCDAHSLWHLATVPLGYIWYEFWVLDSIICVQIMR